MPLMLPDTCVAISVCATEFSIVSVALADLRSTVAQINSVCLLLRT
jgi:hypothetical protein